MAVLLQKLIHQWRQPLRFLQIDHGQSAAPGKHIGEASRLLLLDGMPQFPPADGHHLTQWFSILFRPAADQGRSMQAMTGFEMFNLFRLRRRVRQQSLEEGSTSMQGAISSFSTLIL